MKMKTGPHLKGRQVPPPHGKRSANQPDVAKVQTKGRKAVSPTEGISKLQPATSTATGKHAEIGKGTAHTYFANSRTPVHPHFDRHPHD